jgi:hypothetical protein
MAISEAARRDLCTGLAETFGASNAETLMSVLPFYELDEVATKGDIALLDARLGRLEAEMVKLESRVGGLEREFGVGLDELRKTMYRLTFTTLVTIIGAMATIIAAMAAFRPLS